MIDIEKTVREAAAEMERLKSGIVMVKLPLLNAVHIVSQLQLASRHPDNDGLSGKHGRECCEEIIAVVRGHSPTLADFLELGFNRKYDEIKRPNEPQPSPTSEASL